MAKLYFRYGTVSSAKTLLLLTTAHTYDQRGKRACIIKPALDTRFGYEYVQSRIGVNRKADLIVDDKDELKIEGDLSVLDNSDCILVDEAQFLKPPTIDWLRELTITKDVPVICYGLRTDFKSYLFEGSKRLFEVADDLQEIKSVCQYSNKKATMNLKHVNGIPVFSGASIELGAEEKYYPVSYEEYYKLYKKCNV